MSHPFHHRAATPPGLSFHLGIFPDPNPPLLDFSHQPTIALHCSSSIQSPRLRSKFFSASTRAASSLLLVPEGLSRAPSQAAAAIGGPEPLLFTVRSTRSPSSIFYVRVRARGACCSSSSMQASPMAPSRGPPVRASTRPHRPPSSSEHHRTGSSIAHARRRQRTQASEPSSSLAFSFFPCSLSPLP